MAQRKRIAVKVKKLKKNSFLLQPEPLSLQQRNF
jgi:hypothetical protein